MKLTGSGNPDRMLKAEGVKTIFALPGGVVLKIFDMLHQQKDIEVVLTRHEQGAGHMAEGYAKATGKGRRLFSDLGSRYDQCDYRIGRCLYGFSPAGVSADKCPPA